MIGYIIYYLLGIKSVSATLQTNQVVFILILKYGPATTFVAKFNLFVIFHVVCSKQIRKKPLFQYFWEYQNQSFPLKANVRAHKVKKAIRLIISRNQNMNEMQIKCKSNNLSFQATLNSHSVPNPSYNFTFGYIIWLIPFNNNVRFMTHCCKSKVLEKKYILKTRLV